MKLAYTIAALALAAGIGGLGMTATANAQPAPQGRYCDQNAYTGTANCSYNSWERCLRFAQPNGGWCTVNENASYRAEPYGDDMARRY